MKSQQTKEMTAEEIGKRLEEIKKSRAAQPAKKNVTSDWSTILVIISIIGVTIVAVTHLMSIRFLGPVLLIAIIAAVWGIPKMVKLVSYNNAVNTRNKQLEKEKEELLDLLQQIRSTSSSSVKENQ